MHGQNEANKINISDVPTVKSTLFEGTLGVKGSKKNVLNTKRLNT